MIDWLRRLLCPLPEPPPLALRDVLLKSGMSNTLEPDPLLDWRGWDAWREWGEIVLSDPAPCVLASRWFATDTGKRLVRFYWYRGMMFAFVFMHADDPRAGKDKGAWHGDGFLRMA